MVVESRSSHPLLPLRVVAERNRGGAYLATLLTGAGLFAMFVFLSYYLQSVLHYSALKAGIAFLPFAGGIILAAAASSVAGAHDRAPGAHDRRACCSARSGWRGSPRSACTRRSGPTSCPQELLMSIGLGLAFPALSSTALIKVGDEDSGVASALVNTTQQVGGSLGTALLNTIAATATASYIVAHGRSSALAGTVHGFSLAFLAGSAMLVLAAVASAVFVTARPQDLPTEAGLVPATA